MSSFLWFFLLFTMSMYGFYRRKRNYAFYFIKNITKAMRKRLRLRTVVSLGKAGVELGSQVRLLTFYLLIAVKWSLVFTTGLHNSDTLYTYALVHAANISIFPSLMGDGGNPEFPGPLTDPGSFPHAAPLLEEGGRPRPPACTTYLWPPWRTWAP